MRRSNLATAALLFASITAGCGGEAALGPDPRPATPVVHTTPQIITKDMTTTEAELSRKAEEALMRHRYSEAAEAFRTLLAAEPKSPHTVEYLFGLAAAYEGLEDREKARDKYLEVARRFPAHASAKPALVRAGTLLAYLEDWKALGEIGEVILARQDIDDVDRIVALGSRGLAKVEQGDDLGASKDIHQALDIADRIHYAAGNVLPVAAAQLRFALGEVRRVRSERIVFDPLPADFLSKIEERCIGLLEAQSSYADAVRASDPHWAAMAGYRVGEMYRTLHKDLVKIPPPAESKTEKQKQIFYAFMHVRYRVLLEKGLRQLEQTIALGERTNDSSAWIKRAQAAKQEMLVALEDEKAQIAKFPFKESEIEEALKQLAQKTAQKSPAKP